VAAPTPPLGRDDLKAQGLAWSSLVERLARNLERGGRQWTAGRRKESLRRVLDGSRSDAQRLLQRMQSLMTAWEADQPSDTTETGIEDPPVDASAVLVGNFNRRARGADPGQWPPLVDDLQATVQAGLAPDESRAAELAAELGRLADAVAAEGATPTHVAEIAVVCDQARRLFAHRHRLVEELSGLCRELSAGLTELAEDDSWAQGQCAGLQCPAGRRPERARRACRQRDAGRDRAHQLQGAWRARCRARRAQAAHPRHAARSGRTR
jgi:diguanylate cyclase